MPNGSPILTTEMKKTASERLKRLDKRDNEIQETRKVKNNFEELIYTAREFITEESTKDFVVKDLHEKFIARLVELEDWLYEDGLHAKKEEIEERVLEIYEVYGKGKTRETEKGYREKYYPTLETVIQNLTATIPGWKEDRSWVKKKHWDRLDYSFENFRTHMEKAVEVHKETKDWEDAEVEYKDTFELYKKVTE